jgi:restriction endonuclease S subunit
LAKCCSLVTDGTHYTPPAVGEGVPFVTVKDMTESGLDFTRSSRMSFADFELARKAHCSPQPGDVLFSKDGTVGKVHVVTESRSFAVLSSIAILRPEASLLDSRFLGWVMQSPRTLAEAGQRKTGSALRRIVLSDLASLKVPLPPLPEQRRIAALLDKADAIRRKRQQAIRLADDLLRSAFLDMFGDPVANRRAWPVVALGSIASVQGGLQVTAARRTLPLEVPYLRVANVYRDRFVLDEIKILRVTGRELARAVLHTGDILVVEGHGNPQEIGRCAVWDGSIAPCVHQNHLIRVRARADAEPVYVSAFLNSSGGRQQLAGVSRTTSGLNTISTANVAAVRLPLPPIEFQRRYVRATVAIRAHSRRLAAFLSAADDTHAAIAAMAFPVPEVWASASGTSSPPRRPADAICSPEARENESPHD